MQIELTQEQQEIVNKAVKWYHNSSEQIFQFAGNPGTGKSVVMNAIIQAIGLPMERVAPMAYIGAAAINMRLKGMLNAKTIHSWIYEPIEVPILDDDGNIIMDNYFNRPKVKIEFVLKPLPDVDLIAIDEGGTVPMKMRKDLLNTKKKILVAGDLDQLPPVGDNPAFLTFGEVHVLTEIMRQAKNSAIVHLCQRAKHGLPIHTGVYGNEVIVLERKDFDLIAPKVLPAAGVVLCGKNDTRTEFTKYIRHEILGKTSIIPEMGEKVICRRNNWNCASGGINLTNGLTGRVINQPDVSGYHDKCFTIDFLPDLTDTPFVDVPVNLEYFTADPATQRQIRAFGHCTGECFEFGYTQTVHLSQGSQWNNGIYLKEYLPSNNWQIDYTALSRFRRQCIYVKPNRKYW